MNTTRDVADHTPTRPGGGSPAMPGGACAWCADAIDEHRGEFQKDEGRLPSKLELANYLLERSREEEGTMAAHLWIAAQDLVNA